MQKTKSHAKLGVSLRELADGGIPVDLSVAEKEEEQAEITIEQVGGVYESSVFDLPTGLAGYTFDVIITNRSSRTIYCRDLELRLPWEDSLFKWLRDPREAGKTEYYCFPGGSGPEYDRDIVINHRLLKDGALTQCPLSGLLLATGRPMPKDLFHGPMLEATLAITTFDQVEYRETVVLWTDRSEVPQKRAARRHDLFGEPVGHDIGSLVPAPTEARRGE